MILGCYRWLLLEKKNYYVASLSYGKDSIAMLIKIKELGLPLDEVIFCEIMFDDEISGIHPVQLEFINKARKILKERFDIDVIHLKSMKNGDKIPLHAVITEYTQYKILPKPKRVGDLKCNNECFRNNGQCPIRAICSHCNLISSEKTLYEFLEFYKDKYANEVEFDQEIHDLLKARLDKEVIE